MIFLALENLPLEEIGFLVKSLYGRCLLTDELFFTRVTFTSFMLFYVSFMHLLCLQGYNHPYEKY